MSTAPSMPEELKDFRKRFDLALAQNDVPTLREICRSEEYQRLMSQYADERARRLARDEMAKHLDRGTEIVLTAFLSLIYEQTFKIWDRETIQGARHRKLTATVETMERRLAEQESRPQMEFRGIWSATETYTRMQTCTLGGSMWIVRTASTRDRPGSSGDWQLCVQGGRSGRVADGGIRDHAEGENDGR